MDYTRIAQIYNRVYSTPPNSKQREQALSELSETDRQALYDYDMGTLSGRIKKVEVKEMAVETRNYEWYKKKMDEADTSNMKIISKFAMESPELYKQCRERYQAEKDRERRNHNRKIMGY